MENGTNQVFQQMLAKARVLEQKLGSTWVEHFQDVDSPDELAQRCRALGVVLTGQEAQEGYALLQEPLETELSEEELAQLAGGFRTDSK